MVNINPFYPKRRAGYALGMNGGLGNLGVSLCQLFLGNVLMAFGPAATMLGGTWVPQGLWFLFPFCIVSAFAAFLWMNNMPKSVHAVPENFFHMFGRYVSLQGPAYLASFVGVAVIYATRNNTAPAEAIPLTIAIIIAACVVEHVFIWYLSTPAAKPGLRTQIGIFKDKHTYWMTYLYIMTFGSFIGFSSAFPKLIMDLFDEYAPDDCARLQDEGKLQVGDCSFTGWPVVGFSPAFLGALIGSLIRPVGGMMSDKFGGARVTHYHTVLMTIVTAVLGVIVKLAREAKTNRMDYFPPFFVCFLLLFYGTGVGNGSTFRQIAVIFDKTLAPPVLGWSSAIASFGAFLIPRFFATAIQGGTPEMPFFIFAAYYFTCILVNWWFYFRTGAEKPC
jgi:NNP family nitrate/nitrite transporter-like MFS transporter